MEISTTKESAAGTTATDGDRLKDLKAFDDTKAGVKGLVDSGIAKIPNIFMRPPDELAEELKTCRISSGVPVIDLSKIGEQGGRREIVDEVRSASEKLGFFLVVNHGIPPNVLDGMITGIRRFHEQGVEVKKEFYSRDVWAKKVKYQSNIDLYRSRTANWRDTLSMTMLVSEDLVTEEIPPVCRDATLKYIKHVTNLGETLFELLSEGLGLKKDYLRGTMECAKGRSLSCHYYPACPQPELTLGASQHSDPSILTLVLQDQVGGLQVLQQDNCWTNVQPIPGAFVVNIGDLLQMMSNGRFRSVEHRVLANHIGPRISVACFFNGVVVPAKTYGPIKELLSEENPPLYKEFKVGEYLAKFFSRPIDESGLDYFKL